MDLNVFKLPYTKRYYLTHPLKFIRQCGRNIKQAYKRIRYGWCAYDAWDFDVWLFSVTPPMLRFLADKGCSWSDQKFNSIEEWREWLRNMAAKLEKMQFDDWSDSKNEYSEDYYKSLENDWKTEEHKEIRKKYYDRAKEIASTRQQDLEKVFIELADNIDALWD